MKMIKITVIPLLILLGSAPLLSWAQLAEPPTQSSTLTPPMIDPDCVASTEVCQQRAEKRQALLQRCAADPEWCKEYRAKKRQTHEEAQALKKQCQEHPEQCAELKQQFNQRQAQQRKTEHQKLENAQMQWCLDNQAACEQWKIDFKQMQQKYQELRRQLEEKYPTRPR